MITKKNLYFKESSSTPYICEVGVPQGGVLSTLLFNLALNGIGAILPDNVNILQFADDIILFASENKIKESLTAIGVAIDKLVPLLAKLGFSIAPNKSQLCIFSRSNEDIDREHIVHKQHVPNLCHEVV